MGKVDTKAPSNEASDYLKYEGRDCWWTADSKGEAYLQESETGLGNYAKGIPLKTVPEVMQEAVKKNGKKPALCTENMGPLEKGEKPPPALQLKDWKTWTWQNYYDDSRTAAKAMIALGLEPHDSCNIFGFNSPQWMISLMGAIFAGGKGAGFYPTDTADQVQFKCDHSNGAVVTLESENGLEKFRKIADDLPYLKAIVTWGCEPGDDIQTKDGRTIKTLSWDEFMKIGRAESDDELEKRLANVKPGHCCALIYTSGTTGNPKAVMISHDNILFTAVDVLKVSGVVGAKKSDHERILSYLPLSHVAGMMVDIVAPLVVTANISGFKGSMTAYFARPYDMKRATLVDRLGAVRPTMFLGVPRVWEKIMEKLRAVGASAKGVQKMLSTFAKARGAMYTSTRQLGGSSETPFGMSFANLILKTIKKKLGLDKSKFNFTGAAPMTTECLEFFGALGINVNEVYGMSECTGAVTFSTDAHHVWGSVGFEIPGCELRVFNVGTNDECPSSNDLFAPTDEEQGELCYRGRSIMMGYLANPRLGNAHVEEVEEKNKGAIDQQGFLRSGDKGTRDKRGMVKVTGRYKELIITAGGENIAPVPIEDEIKRLAPYISNVMMVGNKRKFNVCVLSLKAIGATGELPGTNKLAPPASTLSSSKTIEEAMKDEVIIKAITDVITSVNKNEKVVVSNAAKIQKFTILPRDFSVQTGELTATLKLKRNVVDDEFKPIIDLMYSSKTAYVDYNEAPTPNLLMGDVTEEPVVERNLSFNLEKEVQELDQAEENAGEA